MRVVAEIQQHSETIIVEGYNRFLLDSADSEEREHLEVLDQVREVLIHENYMSLVDLDSCSKYDISKLAGHPHFKEIEALHNEVHVWAAEEEPVAA